MYCVAFWFTRRADSFIGFVGTPLDLNLGQSCERYKSDKKPTNGFVAGWNNIGLSGWDLMKIC